MKVVNYLQSVEQTFTLNQYKKIKHWHLNSTLLGTRRKWYQEIDEGNISFYTALQRIWVLWRINVKNQDKIQMNPLEYDNEQYTSTKAPKQNDCILLFNTTVNANSLYSDTA